MVEERASTPDNRAPAFAGKLRETELSLVKEVYNVDFVLLSEICFGVYVGRNAGTETPMYLLFVDSCRVAGIVQLCRTDSSSVGGVFPLLKARKMDYTDDLSSNGLKFSNLECERVIPCDPTTLYMERTQPYESAAKGKGASPEDFESFLKNPTGDSNKEIEEEA